MKPLFPYFGGKRRAAPQVWELLGNVTRYVEPFFGSGAVLLGNPNRPKSELVNDRCHFVANLWRALQVDPAEVERIASAPCSEVELKGRAKWLKTEGADRLGAIDWCDLDVCDVDVAGVWLWQACAAIRGNDLRRGDHGVGIKSFRPASVVDVTGRMARAQVLSGDWSRCVTVATLRKGKPGGVFLDPPYGEGNGVAYDDGTGDCARDVWEWALANGGNPHLRIVVAGYDDGREVPSDWQTVERSEKGGYSNVGENLNRHRERLWASPHCLRIPTQVDMFGGAA